MRSSRSVLQAALQLPATLPECKSCERPTKRATHQANAGLCSACAIRSPLALFDATARSKGTPHSAR